MTETAKIRVLVVDDHPLMRAGCAQHISANDDMVVVGECASGEEAIHMARILQPDVVLMDLLMPGIGGHAAAKRISTTLPGCQIVAVTVAEDEPDARLAQSGIAAKIGKSADGERLAAVVREVFYGQRSDLVDPSPAIAPPPMPAVGLGGADAATLAVSPFAQLSNREMQYVRLLLRGCTTREIRDTLKVSEQSVYNYKYKVFNKLSVRNELELFKLASSYRLLT